MPHTTSERRAGANLVASVVVLVAAAAAVVWQEAIITEFLRANIVLNSIIVAVFFVGLCYVFFRLARIHIEFGILESVRSHFNVIGDRGRMSTETIRNLPPSFIRERLLGYCEQSRRSAPLDGDGHAEKVAMTLSLHSGVTRYIAGLLVFLGLLGTFVGLLTSVAGVERLIANLNANGTENTVTFLNNLKTDLGRPLQGMATAFSTSVFGLTTSLIMGFLHLQLASAQTRFASWLESLDKTLLLPAFMSESPFAMASAIGGAAPAAAGEGVGLDPMVARYMEASQRQLKENLDRLVAIVERTEDMQANYREVLSTIQTEIETTNAALTSLGANQDLIREALGRLVDFERSADESQRLSLSQLQSIAEGLARANAATQAAQKTTEEFHKDIIRVLRQEAGIFSRGVASE